MRKINFKLPNLKPVLGKALDIIIPILPFLFMEFFIKILAENVNYTHEKIVLSRILFASSWITLFVGISICIKGQMGRIIYTLFFLVGFAAFVTQAIYYPYTEFFFGFNLLQSAGEGKDYIGDVVANCSTRTIISCVTVLLLGILAIVRFPKAPCFRWKTFIVVLLAFPILHYLAPKNLGEAEDALKWDTWKNPMNVYTSFSDPNKNMKICGLFEYTVRDTYVTYFRKTVDDPTETEVIETMYQGETPHAKNKYTGMFQGKNVIFVQLEGIDSWMLTAKDTPNLYKMMRKSIVFNNHYSYYTGGGSTFNSELAVTTGFTTPISYTKNPYAFTDNYFPYSLPRMFKQKGYSVNAFHMNSGEFYTRDLNYKNWGYDNYYSLMDNGEYTDSSYKLDRELILNEFFYEKMFKQETPFVNYIITYTPHSPFRLSTETGKLLYTDIYPETEVVPELGEEEVARFYAAETDRMMGLLLQALEDNSLINNTVIVVFTDHYLYTLNDKTILDKYKKTENNLINQTPFFIWSNSISKRQVKKVNSQIDILPTVLNLMGFEYNDEWYIGKDIMDNNYKGFVFFSDYSWYDGTYYVENGEVKNRKWFDKEYVADTNAYINSLIKKNDLTLKLNFFKKQKK